MHVSRSSCTSAGASEPSYQETSFSYIYTPAILHLISCLTIPRSLVDIDILFIAVFSRLSSVCFRPAYRDRVAGEIDTLERGTVRVLNSNATKMNASFSLFPSPRHRHDDFVGLSNKQTVLHRVTTIGSRCRNEKFHAAWQCFSDVVNRRGPRYRLRALITKF